MSIEGIFWQGLGVVGLLANIWLLLFVKRKLRAQKKAYIFLNIGMGILSVVLALILALRLSEYIDINISNTNFILGILFYVLLMSICSVIASHAISWILAPHCNVTIVRAIALMIVAFLTWEPIALGWFKRIFSF